MTGGDRSRNTLKTMNECVNVRSGACVFGFNQGLVSGCLLIGNYPFVYYFVLFLCCFCVRVHKFMPSTDNILIQVAIVNCQRFTKPSKIFSTLSFYIAFYIIFSNATTR